MRSLTACVIAVALAGATRRAAAESLKLFTAWPVRLNLTMPFGRTTGSETLHGFTYGFRASIHVYPTDHGHGIGLGGYADTLSDANTRGLQSLGFSASYPVHAFHDSDDAHVADIRVGGYAGWRWNQGGPDYATRLAVGVLGSIQLPIYFYEIQVGLRLDATVHDGVSSTTVMVDLDLAGLVCVAMRML